jgi:hypothetical protein
MRAVLLLLPLTFFATGLAAAYALPVPEGAEELFASVFAVIGAFAGLLLISPPR